MLKRAKKKVAIFDIDGTIFRNSLLIELHWQLIKAGVFPKSDLKKIDSYYWAWVNRKGTYQDYLDRVIESFDRGIAGKAVSVIRLAAADVVKRQKNIVYRFTRDLIAKVRKDHILVAISGSPIEIVKEFNRYWKFDYIVAGIKEVKNGFYTGKTLVMPPLDKKGALLTLFQKQHILFRSSLGVGDSEADAGIFEVVQRPICFNPTLKLYTMAQKHGWEVVVERKNVIYELKHK